MWPTDFWIMNNFEIWYGYHLSDTVTCASSPLLSRTRIFIQFWTCKIWWLCSNFVIIWCYITLIIRLKKVSNNSYLYVPSPRTSSSGCLESDMAKTANDQDLEFKWGQKMGVDCQVKEAQCYESFTYDGTEYTLYDCIYMYKEGEPEPYIGKLIGIWETVDKTKKVNVQWFFRPSEILSWVGDQTLTEKEIFLATGDGIGLSNVNALEAIVGKCNVICTSEDSRNRQPSEEETKMADYIFHRTFDVGLCTILDKMDDKVGGLEVKYVFNRQKSENVIGLQTPLSSKVEVVNNTITCNGKNKLRIPNSSEEFELQKTYGYHDKFVVIKDVKGPSVNSGCIPFESSDYKSGINSNMLAMSNEQPQARASGKKMTCEVGSTKDGVKKVINNKLRAKEKLNSDALQDRLTKKAKICDSTKPSLDKIGNSTQNLIVQGDNSGIPAFACKRKMKSDGTDTLRLDKGVSLAKESGILKDSTSNQTKKIIISNATNAKHLVKTGNHMERTSRLVKGSVGLKSTSKVHENTRKLSNSNLCKVSVTEHLNEDTKMKQKGNPGQVIDKSGWYNSADIIEGAFQTSCTVITVRRSRTSNPHSGQALVMFKNNETTDTVLRQLWEGCLMLPNGRPLVGTTAPPLNATEKRTYFGHFVIDNIKRQGDSRNAVSTSHCSQPNTIEYWMAMEWCLLQTRADNCWDSLYKQHEKEIRNLMANLKSK